MSERESGAGRFPWPSCAGTHAYAEEALQISNKNDINIGEIEEIKVLVGSQPIHKMLYEPNDSKKNPSTAIGAKFSIPFVVATALKYKNIMLEHFLPQALMDKDVLSLTQKITYNVEPEFETIKQGLIRITTKGGVISSDKVDYIYGHPNNPMSTEALADKFMNCTAYAANKISKRNRTKLFHSILELEQLNDISEIIACLTNY